MTSSPEATSTWSKARWWTSIGVACGIQFALVAVLTIRSPIERHTMNNTRLTFPSSIPDEVQALTDPALLALGGPHGFSRAWLDVPSLKPVDANWEQPPDWLALDPDGLGRRFQSFAADATEPPKGVVFKPPPKPLGQQPFRKADPLRSGSTLRLEGALEARRLQEPLVLPSWPSEGLLMPSMVRVMLDDRGMVMSAILRSGSGSPNADQWALAKASQMRFLPSSVRNTSAGLEFGELVFDWHTLRKEKSPNPAEGE